MKKPPAAMKIMPGDYPVIGAGAAERLLKVLKDPATNEKGTKIVASKAQEFRSATLEHVARLEASWTGHDLDAVFAHAHEIRGLAGNAGLIAAGRIASGLCTYVEEIALARAKPKRSIIALHVEAIARAARASDEATRLGDDVARELLTAARQHLAEVKDA